MGDYTSSPSEPSSSPPAPAPAPTTDSAAITIPIIDICPYLTPANSHAPEDAPLTLPLPDHHHHHLAQSLRAAARSPGFFQVTGHGALVPPDLRARLLARLEAFFALPAPAKAALHRHASPAMRGYEGVGDQVLEPGVLERKEGFTIGAEWDGGDEGDGGARFLQGRNQWPGEEVCPGFKETMMEYFEAVRGLSRVMFRLMALSLGLEERFFDEFVGSEDSVSICRAHRYPPTTPDMAAKTRGIGAHTDFGALTLLLQDDVGGLEVFHRPTQTWHPVKPVEGAFVVNIGDMMERWTNELYTSTLHRVISPVTDKYRYSVAFFNEGRLDQVIECIPTCLKEGEEPKYEPVQVEAHLRMRYGASY